MIELYTLSDPRDGAVRYIGKAKCAKKRFLGHMMDSRRRQTPLYQWVRELSAQGLQPELAVTETCEEERWPARERALIAEARARGAALLNLAPGGNQPFCPPHTAAANARKATAARIATPRLREFNRMKRMLSDNLRHGYVSEATKAKMHARADIFGGWANL